MTAIAPSKGTAGTTSKRSPLSRLNGTGLTEEKRSRQQHKLPEGTFTLHLRPPIKRYTRTH